MPALYTLYVALDCGPENVPVFGGKALQSTRNHAACTNGVGTKTVISGLTSF
jgi:hypothetical protein